MRPLPTKLALKTSYSGYHCRLTVDLPRHRAYFPINSGGVARFDEKKVELQGKQGFGQKLAVGIFHKSFNPLRPLDIAIAAQAMVEADLKTVVFAPRSDAQHHESLNTLLLKVFFPLFEITPMISEQTTEEFIRDIKIFNSDQIEYHWLAPSSESHDQLILEGLRAGLSLDEVVSRVISPHIAKFHYFYFEGEENEIVAAAMRQPAKANLIRLSDDLYPLTNPNAKLVSDGQSYYNIFSSSQGPGVSFELPASGELH